MTATTRRSLIRLSIETPQGQRRRVSVEIDRAPSDSDAAAMNKAAAEYRRLHGFTDRVVAIYVTN